MKSKIIFIKGGNTILAPDDWNNSSNQIIVIGAGGGADTSAGGAGGACSVGVNVQLTPGAPFFYSVGKGGAAGINDLITLTPAYDGGDTWINKTTNAAPSSITDGLLAKGGKKGVNAGAAGGQASAGIGNTKYSGGAGGSYSGTVYGAAGGGGAAGPQADGQAGGAPSGNNGAAGGSSGSGALGGAGGTSSSDGGGGNGNIWAATNVWDGVQYIGGAIGGPGAGGGGGYGDSNANTTGGGAAGAYGGGGGGGGWSGFISNFPRDGAPGLIVLIYDGADDVLSVPTRDAELFFSESVQAMLAGRNIHAALGVWFDFLSGEERVWLGRGTFTANDGTEWQGMGTLATVDGISSSAGLSVDPITMTLSGLTTEILDLTRQQATEIRGRRCGVYVLMFDDDFKPLDLPYLLDLYLMDKATFSVEGESREMSITVTAEPLFSTKHVPRFSIMSDADQQSRYPGDKIFERVALLSGRQTLIWSSDT